MLLRASPRRRRRRRRRSRSRSRSRRRNRRQRRLLLLLLLSILLLLLLLSSFFLLLSLSSLFFSFFLSFLVSPRLSVEPKAPAAANRRSSCWPPSRVCGIPRNGEVREKRGRCFGLLLLSAPSCCSVGRSTSPRVAVGLVGADAATTPLLLRPPNDPQASSAPSAGSTHMYTYTYTYTYTLTHSFSLSLTRPKKERERERKTEWTFFPATASRARASLSSFPTTVRL